jgi:hypothetical protein
MTRTRELTVILTLCAVFITTIGVFLHHKEVKHTGPCQFVTSIDSKRYWFMRPADKELFEMYFDNPPMTVRMVSAPNLVDIYYTDDNADMRHFVKLQIIPQEKPNGKN